MERRSPRPDGRHRDNRGGRADRNDGRREPGRYQEPYPARRHYDHYQNVRPPTSEDEAYQQAHFQQGFGQWRDHLGRVFGAAPGEGQRRAGQPPAQNWRN